MKKLMFNDRYGLTEAVLSGKKTQTRRVFKSEPQGCLVPVKDGYEDGHGTKFIPKYRVGEIVAIAQSYEDAGMPTDEIEFRTIGWMSKLFVKSEFMPHQIEITDVRIERLQDISREDCFKEGMDSVVCVENDLYGFKDFLKDVWLWKASPKEAYQLLISRISGKYIWDENPFVFVYEFKLLK